MKDITENPEPIVTKKKWITPDFQILDEGYIETGSNPAVLEATNGLLYS